MTLEPDSSTKKLAQDVANGSLKSVVEMRDRIAQAADAENVGERDVWEQVERSLILNYLNVNSGNPKVSRKNWVAIAFSGVITAVQVIAVSSAEGFGALPGVMTVSTGSAFLVLLILLLKPALASAVRNAIGFVLTVSFSVFSSLIATAISNNELIEFSLVLWILSLAVLMALSIYAWFAARSVERELEKSSAERESVLAQHALFLFSEPSPKSCACPGVPAMQPAEVEVEPGRRKRRWPFSLFR